MSSIDFTSDPIDTKPRADSADTNVRFRARDEADRHTGTDPADWNNRPKHHAGTGRRGRPDKDWAVWEILEGALFAPVH